jgi:transposase
MVVCLAVRRRHGSGLPQQVRSGGDKRSHRIEAYRDAILAAIDTQVDITLVELTELLRAEYDAVFAPSTIWRFLDRHSMTLKKNGARERAGAARRCRAATRLVQSPARS